MRKFLMLLILVTAAVAVFLNARYGSGAPYPDLVGTPKVVDAQLETALAYAEPIGNVAVSGDGRLFFTVHPESRPEGNRLLEWVDGAAEPYPGGRQQHRLFDTVLGLYIDRNNRLWTIDHGNHGLRTVRILAFDLDSGRIVHDVTLDDSAAPGGSMLQDLRVSADGRYVFAADASIWRQQPAIVVYDLETGDARRVLEDHPSVAAEDYVISTYAGEMAWLDGLVSLKGGVDGLALDAADEWLYYGAVNNSGLYRLPVSALTDPALADHQVADRVERVGDKPLSDGLLMAGDGSVLVTDVEHGAIHVIRPGELTTLLRSPRIRWADNLAEGPDGSLYIADSALPEVILKTTEHVRGAGPYFVFRVPAAAISENR